MRSFNFWHQTIITYIKQVPMNDNTSNVIMATTSDSAEGPEDNNNDIKTIAASPAPNLESTTNDTPVKVVLRMQNGSGLRLDNKGKLSV